MPDGGGVDAEDRDRGARPQPLGDRALADEVHALEDAGVRAVIGFRELETLRRRGGQARDGHVAAVVVQRGEEPGERGEGVGHRPAVHAAVDRVLERPHLDHAVDDAAERRRQCRHADPPVRRVREDERVRPELRAVARQELIEMIGTDLLLALDDHLHADGRCDHPGLVVACAAAVEAAVSLGRLERRGLPLCLVAGRLHVVMGVQQDGGRAVRRGDLAEDRRVRAVQLQETDAPHARVLEDGGGRLRGRADVRGVIAFRRHRRDPHEARQLLTDPRHVLRDASANLLDGHAASLSAQIAGSRTSLFDVELDARIGSTSRGAVKSIVDGSLSGRR